MACHGAEAKCFEWMNVDYGVGPTGVLPPQQSVGDGLDKANGFELDISKEDTRARAGCVVTCV
jgi:hypothetical protein